MKAAIVVLADTTSHGDLGRVVNALETVKEFKEAGDDVMLIFDGAGTKWIATLSDVEHKRHALFEAVSDTVTGVCSYCAAAFGAKEDVLACGFRLLDEFEGHPSLRTLMAQGYQIITF